MGGRAQREDTQRIHELLVSRDSSYYSHKTHLWGKIVLYGQENLNPNAPSSFLLQIRNSSCMFQIKHTSLKKPEQYPG